MKLSIIFSSILYMIVGCQSAPTIKNPAAESSLNNETNLAQTIAYFIPDKNGSDYYVRYGGGPLGASGNILEDTSGYTHLVKCPVGKSIGQDELVDVAGLVETVYESEYFSTNVSVMSEMNKFEMVKVSSGLHDEDKGSFFSATYTYEDMGDTLTNLIYLQNLIGLLQEKRIFANLCV